MSDDGQQMLTVWTLPSANISSLRRIAAAPSSINITNKGRTDE
jgi:hypothetical protein